MTPTILLALLGAALFLPVVTSDDTEEDLPPEQDPEQDPQPETDPAPQTDPNLVAGTAGSDLLAALTGQTVNGLGGNDTLQANNTVAEATLNGGAGDDEIFYQAGSGEARGGDGNDIIRARAAEGEITGSLFGEDGDDVQQAGDPLGGRSGAMLLDGGAGDDSISAYHVVGNGIEEDTLTGGDGEDEFVVEFLLNGEGTGGGADGVITITDYEDGDGLTVYVDPTDETSNYLRGYEIVTPEGEGYTDIVFTYASFTEGVDPTVATIRLEGVTELRADDVQVFAENIGGPANAGTPENDLIVVPGGDVPGRAGDDYLEHQATGDNARDAVLEGEEGNDTLVTKEGEAPTNATLNGGAGDDLLRSELAVQARADQSTDEIEVFSEESFDTFITGDGADRVEITGFGFLTENGDRVDVNDAGLIGRVTDFTPGEDALAVYPFSIPDAGDGDVSDSPVYSSTLTLTEDPEGAFTDVTFALQSEGDSAPYIATIRLDGLTDLTEEDLNFTVLDPASAQLSRPDGPNYERLGRVDPSSEHF